MLEVKLQIGMAAPATFRSTISPLHNKISMSSQTQMQISPGIDTGTKRPTWNWRTSLRSKSRLVDHHNALQTATISFTTSTTTALWLRRPGPRMASRSASTLMTLVKVRLPTSADNADLAPRGGRGQTRGCIMTSRRPPVERARSGK